MNQRPLIIVGGGGHGRETALALLADHPEWDFQGFLDDQDSGLTPEGWPIVGRIDAWTHRLDAHFIVALNGTRMRRRAVVVMQRHGEPAWTTLIHPDVSVHRSCRIGAGSMILGGSRLTVSIAIGEHVIINRGVQVGHDTHIGSFCSINPGAIVAGRVTIGDGVEVGSGATIRQGVKVGHGATIGMGAVVVKDVAANAVVIGNPAHTLREDTPW